MEIEVLIRPTDVLMTIKACDDETDKILSRLVKTMVEMQQTTKTTVVVRR